MTTIAESSVPLKLSLGLQHAKHCTRSLQLFGGSYQPYASHSKLCEGKLFKRKSKPHSMSEERHKINKFANYQKQSRLRPLCFCSCRKNLWFDVMRIIRTQVVRASFRFHLREWRGSSPPLSPGSTHVLPCCRPSSWPVSILHLRVQNFQSDSELKPVWSRGWEWPTDSRSTCTKWSLILIFPPLNCRRKKYYKPFPGSSIKK